MGNTPSKATEKPDTRGRTNPAQPPIMDVQVGFLTQQIGVYSFTEDEKQEGIFEKIDWQKDQKDISDYTKAREAKVEGFLKKYATELENLPSANIDKPTENANFFRELFVRFIHDFNSKNEKVIDAATLALRTTHPQKAAIKINALFGKFGAELYQLALEEEANSNEYMNAVYNKSKQVVKSEDGDGKEWAERPVIIIAGPSASGKSFARDTVIKKVVPTLIQTEKKAEIPNQVVSIDGGVAREVSQMRKLAILAANNKGYPGIKDLHNKSNALATVKDRIYNHAVRKTKHGIVVPETFSAYMKPNDSSKRMLIELCQLKNAKTVFTCVKGKNDKYFRKTVGVMGSSRAWKTAWKQGTAQTSIKENISANRQVLDLNDAKTCESKAYGAGGFYPGVVGSALAERWFAENRSKSPRMTIINDLMPVKVAENGQWVFSDDGDAKLVSMRAVEEYNNYVKSFNKDDTVFGLGVHIPTNDYMQIIKLPDLSVPQQKKRIIDRHLELKRDEIKKKEKNTQPLIEESAFDHYQSAIKQLKDVIVKLPDSLDGKTENPTKLALSQVFGLLRTADLNKSEDVDKCLHDIVVFMQDKARPLPPEVVTALQNIYDPLHSLYSMRRANGDAASAASLASTSLSKLYGKIANYEPVDSSSGKAPFIPPNWLDKHKNASKIDLEAKELIRILQGSDFDYTTTYQNGEKQVFIKDLRQTRVEDLNPIHSQEARIQALRYLRGMLLINEHTPKNATFDHGKFLEDVKAAYKSYEEKTALLPAATVAFTQELLHTFQQIYASHFKVKDVKNACKPMSMAKDLAILLEGPPPDVCTISANKGQITIERASTAKVGQEYYADTFIVNQSRWLPNAVKLAGFADPSDPNNWLQPFIDNNVDALSKAGIPAPSSARWLPLPANNQHIETFVGNVDEKGQLLHGHSTHFIRMGATSAYEIVDREAMDDFSKKQLKELFKNNVYAAIAAYKKKHLALGKKDPFDFHFNYQTLLTPHRGERFAPHTDNNDRFVNAAKEAMWELETEVQTQTNSMLANVNLHFYQTNAPINNVSSWVSATAIDSDNKQRKEKLERIAVYLQGIDLDALKKKDPALALEVATRRNAVDVLRAILNKEGQFGKLAPYQRNVMIAALEFLMEGSQALTLAGCKSARDRTAVFAAAVKTMQENPQAMYDWDILNAGIIHSLKQGQHFRAMMHHCAIAKVNAVHEDFMVQLPIQTQEDIEKHKAFTKSMKPLDETRLKVISDLNDIVAEKKLVEKAENKSEVNEFDEAVVQPLVVNGLYVHRPRFINAKIAILLQGKEVDKALVTRINATVIDDKTTDFKSFQKLLAQAVGSIDKKVSEAIYQHNLQLHYQHQILNPVLVELLIQHQVSLNVSKSWFGRNPSVTDVIQRLNGIVLNNSTMNDGDLRELLITIGFEPTAVEINAIQACNKQLKGELDRDKPADRKAFLQNHKQKRLQENEILLLLNEIHKLERGDKDQRTETNLLRLVLKLNAAQLQPKYRDYLALNYEVRDEIKKVINRYASRLTITASEITDIDFLELSGFNDKFIVAMEALNLKLQYHENIEFFKRHADEWHRYQSLHQHYIRLYASTLTRMAVSALANLKLDDMKNPNSYEQGKDRRSLNEYFVFNQKLPEYIKQAILKEDNLETRNLIIEQWIAIADECLNRNNFIVAQGIYTALETGPVSRLLNVDTDHHSYPGLSTKASEQLSQLRELFANPKETREKIKARVRNAPRLENFATDAGLWFASLNESGSKDTSKVDGSIASIHENLKQYIDSYAKQASSGIDLSPLLMKRFYQDPHVNEVIGWQNATASVKEKAKELLKESDRLQYERANNLKFKDDIKPSAVTKVLGHSLPSQSTRVERKLVVDPAISPPKKPIEHGEKENASNPIVPLDDLSDVDFESADEKTPLVRGKDKNIKQKVVPKPITLTPPKPASTRVPMESTRPRTETPDPSSSLSENEAHQSRPANRHMAPSNQTESNTTRAAGTIQAHLEAIKKFAAYAKSSVAVINAAAGPTADARRAQMVRDCEMSLVRLANYFGQIPENSDIRIEVNKLRSDLNDTLGLLRHPHQPPAAQPGIVHFFAEAKIVENNTEAIKECIEEMSQHQINTDDEPATISVHQSAVKPILATPRNQNGRTTDFTVKANNLARVTHTVINTHSNTTAPQQSGAREGTHVISVQHYVREVFTSECHIKPTAPLEKTTVKKGWFFKPAVKLPHDDILVAGRLFIENHLRSDPKISFGANGEWVGPDIRLAGNFSKDLLESIMLHLIVNKHQDHVVLSKALSRLLGQFKPTPAQINEYRQRMLTLYEDTPVLAYDREGARELAKAATRPAANEPVPARRNSYTSS